MPRTDAFTTLFSPGCSCCGLGPLSVSGPSPSYKRVLLSLLHTSESFLPLLEVSVEVFFFVIDFISSLPGSLSNYSLRLPKIGVFSDIKELLEDISNQRDLHCISGCYKHGPL